MLPRFESLDAVQRWAMEILLNEGIAAAPRSLATIEVLAAGFCLVAPRARQLSSKARAWNEALAVGEFAWHVSGSTELSPLAYYAPRWREFSDDGEHIRGSCYGNRIFGRRLDAASQWECLIELLRCDPWSRRAVLNIRQDDVQMLNPDARDIPCVSTCQFLIRDDKLDAIVHMRSNDVLWGLPYDVYLFTMLQEILSLEMGIELGRYFHFAGSLHLYEKHLNKARGILNEELEPVNLMQPMTDIGELDLFIQAERELINEGASSLCLSPYWKQLLQPVQDLLRSKADAKFYKSTDNLAV